MRILFATTHTYLPQGTGGLEINTNVLCRALVAAGHDARVFCGVHDTPCYRSRRMMSKVMGRTLLQDRRLGYPVYRARYPILSAPEAACAARSDIVVTQGWNAAALAQAFSKAGIPVIVYAHNAQRFGADEPVADVMANSRFTASLHPDRNVIGIVPPLIEPNDYRVDSSRKSVLFVNPIPQKGLAIAINLARARPDIPFDFFEAWLLSSRERAQARAATEGIANIRWHPAVSDMRQAYRRARLVLFPSAMETWGRVASEAHISGIPALASDRGALPDTVGPGGLCVPFDAPAQDWRAALSRLWDDGEYYYVRANAALKFSRRDAIAPHRVLTDFIDLLEVRLAARTMASSTQTLRGVEG